MTPRKRYPRAEYGGVSGALALAGQVDPDLIHGVTPPLRCSVFEHGAGEPAPAVAVMLTRMPGEVWEAFPRCAGHPAGKYAAILRRWDSKRQIVVIDVSGQAVTTQAR